MRALATLGAINAFLAVAAGAFGAHGLRNRLTPRNLEVFEVAVRYQMFHALGLFAAAWLASRAAPGATISSAAAGGWLLVAGIVVFSGSLYALALTGVTRLGMITPVGGLCFLVGWALLAWAAWRGSPA